MYLKLEKENAEKFLSKIKDQFQEFYNKRNVSTVKWESTIKKQERKVWYWRDFVGNFLTNSAKSDHKKLDKAGETNKYFEACPFDEKPLGENGNKIIGDYTLLYDISKDIKKNNVIELPWDSIRGLFLEFLGDEDTYHSYGRLIDVRTNGTDSHLLPYYNELFSNKWLLYCFAESSHIVNGDKITMNGIKKDVIKFSELIGEKKHQIELHSQSIENKVYKGKFGLNEAEGGHIYLETTPLQIWEGDKLLQDRKHLRIMLYFGRNRVDKLALGIYYNVRFHGALLAGSTLLIRADTENQLEYYNNPQKVEFISRYAEIEETVWSFFERRNLNFIKIPSLTKVDISEEKYDLIELDMVLKGLRKKESGKDIWLTKYNFFISIPLSFAFDEAIDPDSEANKIAGEIFSTNKAIAEIVIQWLSENITSHPKIFFAPKVMEEEMKKEDSHEENILSDLEKYDGQKERRSERTLPALERSNVYVLIFPKRNNKSTNRISSAIIELGYAIALKKKILIIVDKNELQTLPNNIEVLESQRNGTDFLRIEYRRTDKLKATLDTKIIEIKKLLE